MICNFEDFVNYLISVDLSKVPKTVYCSSRSYRQAQRRPTSLQSKPLTLGVKKDERFWLAVAKTGQNWTSKNGKVCPKSFDRLSNVRLSNVGSLSYHLAKEVWIKDNPWSLKLSALSLKLLQVEHAQFHLDIANGVLQTTEIFGKVTTSQFNKNVPDPLLNLQRKRVHHYWQNI